MGIKQIIYTLRKQNIFTFIIIVQSGQVAPVVADIRSLMGVS